LLGTFIKLAEGLGTYNQPNPNFVTFGVALLVWDNRVAPVGTNKQLNPNFVSLAMPCLVWGIHASPTPLLETDQN
jgi:hypothetical protein